MATSVEQNGLLLTIQASPSAEGGELSVRSRGGIVRGPQMLAWQFILLAVVHATRGEALPCPNVTTSSTLSTLAATDEGEDGEDNVSESHRTDSGNKSNDEALVLIVTSQVDVARHIIAVTDGVSSIGLGEGAVVGVGGAVVGIGSGSGVGIRVIGAGGSDQGSVTGGVGGVGRRPSGDKRLELFSGLITTGDFTACGALLKSEGDVIGDLFSNLLDFGLVDAKSSRENIRGETEESLSDLVYAWERIPEEGDEGHRIATVIVFKMDGALREESSLVGEDLVEDVLGSILGDHASDERAVGNEVELWGPRVSVGGVETTWAEETSSD